jgi:hypothetical protein
MDVIWDDSSRVLAANRVAYLGTDEVREELRSQHVTILVADIGSDLLRLSGEEAFRFWKEQAAPRLVAPERVATGFELNDYPGETCYLASKWDGPDVKSPVLLFERYH